MRSLWALSESNPSGSVYAPSASAPPMKQTRWSIFLSILEPSRSPRKVMPLGSDF